ncbi:MAG: shikimate dehydrogenase [Alistipes sp.]
MRQYGLIGFPLAHSASARYFEAKFAREQISDSCYDIFELKAMDELPPMLAANPDLRGFNVTIPYKQQIIPRLTRLSTEAEWIGAVNCVRRDGDQLTGYNTDVVGVRAALAELLEELIPEQALVLGTGGASQAVQYVLSEMGIAFDLVSRDPAKGNFTYDNLPCDEVEAHRLIINTSPVGMFPHVDEAPRIPYAFITPDHYLLDLIYNPVLTSFLDYGQQRGAHILGGQTMFEAQAEASWQIWNE